MLNKAATLFGYMRIQYMFPVNILSVERIPVNLRFSQLTLHVQKNLMNIFISAAATSQMKKKLNENFFRRISPNFLGAESVFATSLSISHSSKHTQRNAGSRRTDIHRHKKSDTVTHRYTRTH